MAKWLEASASVSIPVSGDLATTANFALVVSGVPDQRGEDEGQRCVRPERVDARRGQVGAAASTPSPAPPM